MYQNFIIPYLYEDQQVSGNTPLVIRSLKPHWHPPVFIRGKLLDVWLVDVVRHSLILCLSCWIILYELYYDARIHEHHVNRHTCRNISPSSSVWS